MATSGSRTANLFSEPDRKDTDNRQQSDMQALPRVPDMRLQEGSDVSQASLSLSNENNDSIMLPSISEYNDNVPLSAANITRESQLTHSNLPSPTETLQLSREDNNSKSASNIPPSINSSINASDTANSHNNLNQNASAVGDNVVDMAAVESIEIPVFDYPADLKEEQYDVVLICSSQDVDFARLFSEILKKFLILADKRHPEICMVDEQRYHADEQRKIEAVRKLIGRSTYIFFYLTKEFCKDAWAEFQRDECIMESIEKKERKWSVVPINTKPKKESDYEVPFGLKSLRGVDISQMLKGRSLEQIQTIDKVKEGDIDQYFIKNMTKMLDNGISNRQKRQREQQKRLDDWIREERLKRYIKQKEEESEERIKRQHEAAEIQRKMLNIAEAEKQKMAQNAAPGKNPKIEAREHLNPSDCRKQNLEREPTERFPVQQSQIVHVHHYHGSVVQELGSQTTVKIMAPVGQVQIGDENAMNLVHPQMSPELVGSQNSLENYEVSSPVLSEPASPHINQNVPGNLAYAKATIFIPGDMILPNNLPPHNNIDLNTRRMETNNHRNLPPEKTSTDSSARNTLNSDADSRAALNPNHTSTRSAGIVAAGVVETLCNVVEHRNVEASAKQFATSRDDDEEETVVKRVLNSEETCVKMVDENPDDISCDGDGVVETRVKNVRSDGSSKMERLFSRNVNPIGVGLDDCGEKLPSETGDKNIEKSTLKPKSNERKMDRLFSRGANSVSMDEFMQNELSDEGGRDVSHCNERLDIGGSKRSMGRLFSRDATPVSVEGGPVRRIVVADHPLQEQPEHSDSAESIHQPQSSQAMTPETVTSDVNQGTNSPNRVQQTSDTSNRNVNPVRHSPSVGTVAAGTQSSQSPISTRGNIPAAKENRSTCLVS